MRTASDSLRQWYWGIGHRLQLMLRKLRINTGLMRHGFLPFSQASKCVASWDGEFHWMRWEARKAGFTVANRDNLLRHKKSDTLFILGSGSSINDISEAEWSDIARHDSIGFNYFLAHPFVPTYYHIELLKKDMDMFRDCYAARRDAYANIPFMINYLFIANDYTEPDLAFIKNKLVTIARCYTNCRPDDMERIVHLLFGHVAPGDDYFLLHYRGSLTVLVSLAVLLGYKKIVLAGIDLKNSAYFFCDERYACDATERLRHARCTSTETTATEQHATADPSFDRKTVTIDKVLQYMSDAVLMKGGIELYVYSKESLLYPTFPAWHDN